MANKASFCSFSPSLEKSGLDRDSNSDQHSKNYSRPPPRA